MQELVVLVDEQNTVLGTTSKATVHTTDTPLHRGFSLFLFNPKGELLLTQRAKTKKTFPGVWTNTVCGHPAPDESAIDAAIRRAQNELGINAQDVHEVLPYKYRFADANGIVEHEICPILIGHYDGDVVPSDGEVEAWKWVSWEEFRKDSTAHPEVYSPWCREEADLLAQHALVPSQSK